MSIVGSEIIRNNPPEYKFKFEDHLGNFYYENWTLEEGVDAAAFMAARIPKIELMLAQNEANRAWANVESETNPSVAFPAQHQTDAELYRRVLALGMNETNARLFALWGLDFFRDFESSGAGNNKPQRAEYLGVPLSEYDEVDKRFNDGSGARSFLLDEKGAIWEGLPENWWG